MKTFDLKGTLRNELGKKATKAVRANGNVPCVLYGNGKVSAVFEVAANDVRKLIYTPEIFLVNLDVNGTKYEAIIQELQFHPVNDKILHIDFLLVDDKKPVAMSVPVVTTGHAAGVKAGGKLVINMRTLRAKGLAANIPESLSINVETLGLGKTISVGELKFDNIELIDNAKNVVVSVKTLRGADTTDTATAAAPAAAAPAAAAPAKK